MNKKLLKLVALASIIALPLVGCGSDDTLGLPGENEQTTGTPDNTTPDNTTPDNTTPDNTTPDNTTPVDNGNGGSVDNGNGGSVDNGGVTPGPVTSTDAVSPSYVPSGMMPNGDCGALDIDPATFALDFQFTPESSEGWCGVAWLTENSWQFGANDMPEGTTAVTFEAKATAASNLIKAVAKISEGVETEEFITVGGDWQSFSISFPQVVTATPTALMVFFEGTESQTLSVRNVKWAN